MFSLLLWTIIWNSYSFYCELCFPDLCIFFNHKTVGNYLFLRFWVLVVNFSFPLYFLFFLNFVMWCCGAAFTIHQESQWVHSPELLCAEFFFLWLIYSSWFRLNINSGAASENNRSPLGLNVFWWLQEGIFTLYDRVGQQKCLGSWLFAEHPSVNWTWRKYFLNWASWDTTCVYLSRCQHSLYISSG